MTRLSALLLLFACHAHAQYQPPNWELGIALGYLNTTEYRGARSQQNYFIPFPYIAYRGEIWHVDEEGIRGELLERGGWKLDFRVGGNVPVTSSKVDARVGMPDLPAVVELGPSIERKLWARNEREAFWLRLPWRLMFPVADPLIEYQGWSFAPYLEYVYSASLPNSKWNVGVAFGPFFNNEGYHEYFYEVDAHHANSDRPEYHPGAGYSGTRSTLTITGNTRKFWYGAFARYDDLHNAAFIDSPLVEKKNYFTFGVAVGWIFLRASARY